MDPDVGDVSDAAAGLDFSSTEARMRAMELEIQVQTARRERCFLASGTAPPKPLFKEFVDKKRGDEIREFLSDRRRASPERLSALSGRPQSDPVAFRIITEVKGTPMCVTSALTGDRVYCGKISTPAQDEQDAWTTTDARVVELKIQMEAAALRTPPPKDTAMTLDGQNQQLWVLKYAPRTFSDLVTDDKLNRELMKWLKAWTPGEGAVHPPSVSKGPASAKAPSRTPNRRTSGKTPSRPSKDSPPLKITDFISTSTVKAHSPTQTPRPEPPKPTFQGQKILMFCGPVGVGKSSLVKIAAKMCGYHPFVIDACCDRSAEALGDTLRNALQMQSLRPSQRRNCVIFDAIDALEPGPETRRSIQKIESFVRGGEKLRRPMIFVCNAPHAPYLKQLRKLAKILYVPQTGVNRAVVERLIKICRSENLPALRPDVTQLVEETCNDISACLNILQFSPGRASGDRRRTQTSPFQIWESILTPPSEHAPFLELLETYERFGEYELILKGIQHNYTRLRLHESRLAKSCHIMTWLSRLSSSIWKVPQMCPVYFAAIRRLIGDASGHKIRVEWPMDDIQSIRTQRENTQALQSFLPALHRQGLRDYGQEAFVLDVFPALMSLTEAGASSLRMGCLANEDCRLKLLEVLSDPVRGRPAVDGGAARVVVKRMADVTADASYKKVRQ